ncbi:hypothetical protein PGB90_006137 [Kerria lacca]
MINFIRTALPITYHRQIIWSDSKCALSWIRTHRILPTFIQRRVDEIRNTVNVSFRYVPSLDNAADIPSRGATFEEMNNSIWWNGPAWIETESQWPPEIYDFNELEIDHEWAPLIKIGNMSLPVMRNNYQSPFNLPLEKYSSYLRLLRVTKYVVNFLQRVSNNRIPLLHSKKLPLAQAEFIWLKNEQEFHFAEVFDAIKRKRRPDLVSKLNLFIDPQGLLRCAHRLCNADLPYVEKFPILLPNTKSSHFVRLLITYFHELTYHQGTAYTLNILRREFWILRGRATVSAIVRKCARCKRFRTRPYQQPIDSDIPTLRLQRNVIPFEYIGMDTAGPLYVQHEKRYILLVTDLVIRAIDLELLTEMTTEEISLAFRRIVARRTNPKFILSDNAKQFHLLQSVLSATSRTDLTWKFTPEHSPWIGGAYERMIALTKGSLLRTFHGQALSDITLRTALAEIAAVLNGRPLTYVSEDIQDKPLPPNHFLRSFLSLPQELIPDTSRAVTRKHLTALWKKCNEITNQFWHQWNTNYLQFLREQHHNVHFPKKVTVHSPQVGTVVLVVEKHLKRAAWQLGRITHLNYSSDGQVRSVDLKIKNNQIITRPVSLLCPMELQEDENSTSIHPTTHQNTSDEHENDSTFDEIEEISCEIIDE